MSRFETNKIIVRNLTFLLFSNRLIPKIDLSEQAQETNPAELTIADTTPDIKQREVDLYQQELKFSSLIFSKINEKH